MYKILSSFLVRLSYRWDQFFTLVDNLQLKGYLAILRLSQDLDNEHHSKLREKAYKGEFKPLSEDEWDAVLTRSELDEHQRNQ